MGFLTIAGDEVGLGENLNEILAVQRLNRDAEIQIRTKGEHIQEVLKLETEVRHDFGGNAAFQVAQPAGSELLGACLGGRVEGAGTDESGPEILLRLAAYFGKLDPQHNLSGGGSGRNLDIVDDRRPEAAHHRDDPFHHLRVRRFTHQGDHAAAGRQTNLLPGKRGSDMLLNLLHVWFDVEGEEVAVARPGPDHHARQPGSLPVDQHLTGRNHNRIRNAVVGDRDAADFLGVIQHDRTADRQRNLISRRRLLNRLGCVPGRSQKTKGSSEGRPIDSSAVAEAAFFFIIRQRGGPAWIRGHDSKVGGHRDIGGTLNNW